MANTGLLTLAVAVGLAQHAVAGVVNTTMYRVTPRNYSGVMVDVNSGDLEGDCSFALWELSFPYWCPANPNFVWCTNTPILNIPGNNVYEVHTIEHDDRWGAYSLCNPDPDTGVFVCEHTWVEQCWWMAPNADDFKRLCSRTECHCPAVSIQSVGRELCPMCFLPWSAVPDLPQQCETYATYMDKAPASGTILSSSPSDAASCCSKCTEAGKDCSGIVHIAANNTCTLYSSIGDKVVDAPGSFTGATRILNITILNGTGNYWMSGVVSSAHAINGTWFATRKAGQCLPGQSIDAGDCWWRKLPTPAARRVNATCVSNNLVTGIHQQRPDCWDACPPGTPLLSECSIRCVWDAIAGSKGKPPLTGPQLCRGFVSSFASSDPAQLGCPQDNRGLL